MRLPQKACPREPDTPLPFEHRPDVCEPPSGGVWVRPWTIRRKHSGGSHHECTRKSQSPSQDMGTSLALAASGLLVATCLVVSGFSVQVTQPNNTDADLQQFVGTWHAQFKSKTFETIKLEKQEGKLTGTASHAEIQLDKDGELTSAEEIDGSDLIVEAKLTSGVLRVIAKEEDSQDTIEFEMKLIETDQAELRILTPPDVPTPKPWRLERAKAGR
jgi:hypothetical protein